MSKRVHRDSTIILGGVDISDRVESWFVGAKVGELYKCQLTILDCDFLEITPGPQVPNPRGLRVAKNDIITVGGVDVSRWIEGYTRNVRVGEIDTVTLTVQCDSESLSINGTHPWEDNRE